ncbi:MAG: hypothetical protein FJ399_00330 [Verrucomicrobia bacterium]|nr:hypothetical protein [Verrucomicrobiota bacterium]
MNSARLRLAAPRLGVVWILFVSLAATLPAGVTGLEIVERSAVLDGKAFGRAGAYERIVGRVRFALEPGAAANAAVRDLALAEADANGRVAFSATFYLLRPVEAAPGNGTLLLEVPNRGRKGLLARFCLARSSDDPRTADHFGDAWLFEQGFTLGWIGWQWDVPDAQPLRLDPARLRDPHAPGLVRAEFIPDRDTPQMPLGDREHHPIPLAEALRLGVRDTPEEPSRDLAAGTWRIVEGGRAVELDGGFRAGRMYELVYRGTAGVVTGLGLVAFRDFVAFAKHGGAAADALGAPRRAIGFGVSQSGRFLRHFLYEGFNADEQGRLVFDGVWADVAGAGRGSFNQRYGQASRDGNPWTNVLYPTDVFPFHDRETQDPVTGRRDALLAAAEQARVGPKIFYTNSSYEYWGRAAALVHSAPDGRTDVPLAPATRYYAIAGAQHGAGTIPPATGNARFPALPTDQRPLHRALLAALQTWVADDRPPPESVYPQLGDGTLVPAEALALPKLKDVELPRYPRRARRLEFGADFERTGIMTAERLESRGAFPLLVPALDADGIDRRGLRLPQVAVPLGSYLGWNFRATSGQGHLVNFLGSFIPFAKTAAERAARGDPRPAIAERYRDREDYLARARAAADQLVRDRHLLPIDRDRAVDQCAQLWDHVMR